MIFEWETIRLVGSRKYTYKFKIDTEAGKLFKWSKNGWKQVMFARPYILSMIADGMEKLVKSMWR